MGRGTGRGRARDRCCPGGRVAEELARASDMAASLAGKRPLGAWGNHRLAAPNLYSKTNVRLRLTLLWKLWKGWVRRGLFPDVRICLLASPQPRTPATTLLRID